MRRKLVSRYLSGARAASKRGRAGGAAPSPIRGRTSRCTSRSRVKARRALRLPRSSSNLSSTRAPTLTTPTSKPSCASSLSSMARSAQRFTARFAEKRGTASSSVRCATKSKPAGAGGCVRGRAMRNLRGHEPRHGRLQVDARREAERARVRGRATSKVFLGTSAMRAHKDR